MPVQYTGKHGNIPRYDCIRGRLDYGEPNCIGFGGLRVDDTVEAAVLAVIQPAAETQTVARRDQARELMMRDLEAARYAAERAFRQYDAADPENRLVTGELESRWDSALVRVADIMHAGEDLPLVSTDALMAEALIVMTAKRLGCVGATDPQGALAGIVTDGDLRRHMEAGLLQRPVCDIMTRDPVTVHAGALGAEAVHLMNEHQITSLFVIEARQPVGVVHIHDCLRAGLA